MKVPVALILNVPRIATLAKSAADWESVHTSAVVGSDPEALDWNTDLSAVSVAALVIPELPCVAKSNAVMVAVPANSTAQVCAVAPVLLNRYSASSRYPLLAGKVIWPFVVALKHFCAVLLSVRV